MRQFFLDTPSRATAWSGVQGCANDGVVNFGTGTVDDPWDLYPDLLSPHRPDTQCNNGVSAEDQVTLDSDPTHDINQAMSHQAAAQNISPRRHHSLHSNAHLSSNLSSPNDALPPSDVSSVHDSSSTNGTPSPLDAPFNDVSSLTTSTPASTPPSAYRASFEPANSVGGALETTPNRQKTRVGPINKRLALNSNESSAASATLQTYISPYVEDVNEPRETSQIGESETHESNISHLMQSRILEIDDIVASTNEERYACPSTLDTSNDDWSKAVCYEENRATDCRSIPSRENTPCASQVPVEAATTFESVCMKRKAPTTKANWKDKFVKTSGSKPFIALQLQNTPGHAKQPVEFLKEIRTGRDISQNRAILLRDLRPQL